VLHKSEVGIIKARKREEKGPPLCRKKRVM
jgi:hypothetical protein